MIQPRPYVSTGLREQCVPAGSHIRHVFAGSDERLNIVEGAEARYRPGGYGAETLTDVLSVHPYTIVRGQTVENSFGVEPAALVAARRRGGRCGYEG